MSATDAAIRASRRVGHTEPDPFARVQDAWAEQVAAHTGVDRETVDLVLDTYRTVVAYGRMP